MFDLTHVLQDAVVGAGLGTLAAKIVVHRTEQRRGEMTSATVRKLEVRWVCAAALIGPFVGEALR